MFSKLVSVEDAVHILDVRDQSVLDEAIARGQITPAQSPKKNLAAFRLSDIVLFKLAQALERAGVDPEKAPRYAHAILGSRLSAHDKNLVEWIENESQELFCLIEDYQLARIFLRSKHDGKELDVGAVKPILLPATRCEINVFRVIRPVVYRARQLLSAK
jgi:hypothetical protein